MKVLNNKELEEIYELAKLRFTPSEIANNMQLDFSDFIDELKNTAGEVHKKFYSG